MLWGERVGEGERQLEPGGLDQRERRVRDGWAVRGERLGLLRDRVQQRRVGRGRDEQGPLAVFRLRAEVERRQLGVRRPVADQHQLARAGDDPVQANVSVDLALRLGDVTVPGAGDDVDRRHALGPVGERPDRLRAADRVHLLNPDRGARGQHGGGGPPGRPRRRDDDDPADPREPRGDAAHEHR